MKYHIVGPHKNLANESGKGYWILDSNNHCIAETQDSGDAELVCEALNKFQGVAK